MGGDPIPGLLREVDAGRIRADLFHLAKDPLPFRKLNYTLPGHEQCTLYEADAFIQGRLEALGYAVEREACRVQAYRCDAAKPKHHQYATPEPDDPWYTAYNLSVRKAGTTHPDEIIVLIAHKDSQSWVDSPGANDNAIGTACVLELARALADRPSERSLWILFCNEEHTPWTSITAARNARERGDNIVAAINMDGVRDTIVRGNVIYNNYAGGITCFQGDGGGPGKGNQILNNTVYFRASEGRYALQLLGAVKDIIVRGNVLVSGKGPAFEVNEAAVGGFVAGRNLYWVLNGQPPFGVGERRMALSQWRDRSGQDARSLAADPGFVDVKQGDFTFKPDSPVHALRQ